LRKGGTRTSSTSPVAAKHTADSPRKNFPDRRRVGWGVLEHTGVDFIRLFHRDGTGRGLFSEPDDLV
jgi:hypothetical protein